MNEVLLYQAIVSTDAQPFIQQLDSMDAGEPVKVRINSPGGDVFAGVAIFNALSKVQDVEIYIEGLAASIASFIALAGKKIYMASNALIMIHKPNSHDGGNADDLRERADLLDKIESQLIKAYTKKTGIPEKQLQEMFSQETWLTADEALKLGFIDEIIEPSQMAASIDLSIFNAVPEKITAVFESNKKRVTEIQNLVSHFKNLPSDFTASLINDPRISVEAAREQLLTELGKDAAPVGGAPHIEVSNMEQSQSFINDARDALLIRGGIGIKDVTTGARDMAKYSIVNIAEQYLKLNGTNTMGFSNDQIIAQAYNIRASHSTSDFPNLLENVASKAMRMAYMEEPASHKIWTGETEVRDFKQNSLAQISEAPDLELLPENGEYKHGTIGDSAEKFSILTYGKMFKISRQALINDDLNAFTRLPQAFGQSASRKEADLVYQVLTSNPALSDGVTLFHADHSNIVAVSGVLSLTILGQARALMRKQKGPAGLQPLNVVPRFLIVPAALETVAEQLIASLVDPTKSNDTPNLEFIRNLTLVVDSRLDEDSETKCYLAASPGQIDTITRAYLMGEGRPHIETQQGWEVDGTALKCRMDFAAVPVDFRGLVQVDLS
ncbi:MAG: head maturation protease, ClpP-related [Pseudomonadota bacterium]|nr:head maturation protease, ClpP-related [Pseudomonadota bacterium]